MARTRPHVLFITTHALMSGHGNWNLELLDALAARSIPTSTLSLLDDRAKLTPQAVAQHSHVCFLLLGDYPTHHRTFSKFLEGTLAGAQHVNPALRVLNSPRMTLWNSDKKYLGELQKAGFTLPYTALINPRQPLEYVKLALFTQCHGNPVVVKPSISASGARTHLVRNPQALTPEDDAFLAGLVSVALKGGTRGSIDINGRAKSPPSPGVINSGASQDSLLNADEEAEDGTFGATMMQEYISDVEKGEYSLCFAGGKYLYTVLKRPKDGGWQVGSAFGGTFAPVPEKEVPPDARSVAERLIKWIERRFEGDRVEYARVDGVMRKDGTFTLMGRLSCSSVNLWVD